jgi:hypothetical protein
MDCTGALEALGAREITRAMRDKRRIKIKEANFEGYEIVWAVGRWGRRLELYKWRVVYRQ